MNIYKVLYYIYCISFDSRTFADRFDYVIVGVSLKIHFDQFKDSIPVCTREQGLSNPNNYSVIAVDLGTIEGGRNATYFRVSYLKKTRRVVRKECKLAVGGYSTKIIVKMLILVNHDKLGAILRNLANVRSW